MGSRFKIWVGLFVLVLAFYSNTQSYAQDAPKLRDLAYAANNNDVITLKNSLGDSALETELAQFDAMQKISVWEGVGDALVNADSNSAHRAFLKAQSLIIDKKSPDYIRISYKLQSVETDVFAKAKRAFDIFNAYYRHFGMNDVQTTTSLQEFLEYREQAVKVGGQRLAAIYKNESYLADEFASIDNNAPGIRERTADQLAKSESSEVAISAYEWALSSYTSLSNKIRMLEKMAVLVKADKLKYAETLSRILELNERLYGPYADETKAAYVRFKTARNAAGLPREWRHGSYRNNTGFDLAKIDPSFSDRLAAILGTKKPPVLPPPPPPMSPPPPPPPPPPPVVAPPNLDPNFAVLPLESNANSANYPRVLVHYATHRNLKTGKFAGRDYGNAISQMTYGIAAVNVPKNPDMNSIPKPSIWKGEFKYDEDKHVFIRELNPLDSQDAFIADIKAKMEIAEKDEIVFYIHGYNTDFEGAIDLSAMISVGLNLDGAMVTYSWVSAGSLIGYFADEKFADDEKYAREIAQLLTRIRGETGAKRFSLVAHSMGNRIALNALKILSQEGVISPFDETVLASPDVAVTKFEEIWPQIQKASKNYTLYSSSRDKALTASMLIHLMPRAGNAAEKVNADGLTTIDTTAASEGLLGHGDFKGSALDDFRSIIWFGARPETRCLLRQDSSARVWRFVETCGLENFSNAILLRHKYKSRENAIQAIDDSVQEYMAYKNWTSLPPDWNSQPISKVRLILEKMN